MADELESESAVALLEFKNGRRATGGDEARTKQVKQENTDEEDETATGRMEIEDEEGEEEEAEDDEEEEPAAADEDEANDVPRLGPAALGLQRVGAPTAPKPTPTQPVQVLNARGMPARIRKKNRLFFDDDIVNTPHHRVPSAKKQKAPPTKKVKTLPKEGPKSSPRRPVKDQKVQQQQQQQQQQQHQQHHRQVQVPDRKIGQKIGMRLRNLLKLPKAHKWVCYEWFYSNIDRTLFAGENDFSICLRESFPELKTRELTRIEWTKIRRMMGKPRRCSQAFFNEERLELEKKRNKIRALQQRKATDMVNFKDLPPEIPMQLVIGTKVTARLRKPQDGLFTGSVDAFDTSNNTYRVTFERQGLGTHSVPDYEILSNEPPETMTISSFQSKRPTTATRNGLSPYSKSSPLKSRRAGDPLLSLSMANRPQMEGRVGGFPVRLLQKMVLVTKILGAKRNKIKLLKSMNTDAEKYNSFDTQVPEDFERRYAFILVDLEKLNNDLQMYLEEMQSYCQEIAPEPSVAAMLAPSHLRERCREEAVEIVQRHNTVITADKGPVTNESILELITDLTALMLQVKSLADSDQNAYELQVLQGTMEQIKRKISPANQSVFHNNVEVHMKHILVGLGNNNSNNKGSVNDVDVKK